MNEHEELLRQHCEREETKNELGLAYVRQCALVAVVVGFVASKLRHSNPVEMPWSILALLFFAILANLVLVVWLRRGPAYHPARKYAITSLELMLMTYATQSVVQPGGAIWMKMVPLLTFLAFVYWGALRYSIPLVACVGVEALILYETVIVPRMAPSEQLLVRFGAGVHLMVATLTAIILIKSLRSLSLEIIVKRRQSQRKDIFVGSVSHELRQPLTAILGYSHILADGLRGPLSEVQRSTVSAIMGSADHLMLLIDDLLDIASIEAGHLELNVEELSLAQVLRKASLSIEPQRLARGLEMVVQVPDDEVWIEGDFARLCQIFVNLLGNAVKYTAQGRIGYILESLDGTARVRVWDTGPGIAEVDLPRVFDEFWKGQAGGTGLGLSISRRLVLLHGGDIRVTSDAGQGCEFTVVLPKCQPSNR